MKIGVYEVYSVECEYFALDGGAMFGIVPKTIWQKKIKPDELNRIPMAARAMLIIGNGKKILVDTGIGQKLNEKQKNIYNISDPHLANNLLELKQISIQDITDVILTHLHFDHTGGATIFDYAGHLRPTFPNAMYHVQEEHFEWAKRGHIREKASFMPENFMPIYELGKLNLLKGKTVFSTGIELIPVFGHTIAMQMVKIFDDRNILLNPVDLIPMAEHIAPHYGMAYDLCPIKNIEEKSLVIKQALEENWTFFSCHDPKIHAFKIKQTNKTIEIAETVNFNS